MAEKVLSLLENNILLFKRGRNDRAIAHSIDGKVVLSRDRNITPGYYRVTNVEEKSNVIICNAERELFDYYNGITYAEFLKLLDKYGYKIGFFRDFESDLEEKTFEKQIFAYNVDTKVFINACTINNGTTLVNIDVTCPLNGFEVAEHPLIYARSSKDVVLSFGRFREGLKPFQYIERLMERYDAHEYTDGDFTLVLWTYADETIHHLDRIKLVRNKEDMRTIFGNCSKIMQVLEG